MMTSSQEEIATLKTVSGQARVLVAQPGNGKDGPER